MSAQPPWLLLRGLTRESRHWGEFPATLQAAFGDAPVIAPDLPGNGSLCQQRSPTRIADMVEAYRDQLRQRGAAPPYRLLALSMGGMIAVDWAQRHAEEVAAMVLINVSLRGINSFHARLRPQSYPGLLRLLISDAVGRERIILARTSNLHRGECALIETWADYRRQCPVSTCNALRQLIAAGRYRAPASPPAVPTLLLAAAGDRLVDAECSRQIADAWRAQMAVHPNAGHDLPLDAGTWIVSLIGDWLHQSHE